MISDLIFDIGMHNGDDTDHYLRSGYRVVAVEANPALVEAAKLRFRDSIADRRLVIRQVGIALAPGVQTFWVHQTTSEISSFDRRFAERFGGRCEPIQVECTRFSALIEEFGVPFYLKIDIEGADSLCLEDLRRDDLPIYVSAEAHSLTPLFLLHANGYRDFKCVNQLWHRGAAASPTLHSRKAAEALLGAVKRDLRAALTATSAGMMAWRSGHELRKRWKRRGREEESHVSPSGIYPKGSSGPFGEDTPGPWRSFEDVAYDWLHVRLGYPERGTLPTPGWYDFHSRLTGA